MSLSSWVSYPTPDEVKARIDEFTSALARGDLPRAFAICPVREDGEVKNPADHAFFDTFLRQTILQFVEDQAVLDGEALDEEKPLTILRFLTSPLPHTAEELAFEMPDAGPGEVFINVPVKGEMTDITARYSLHDVAGAWHLYFDNFDIL